MQSFLTNANYYLAESQSVDNDLLLRKRYCELALEFYNKAINAKIDCSKQKKYAQSVYIQIGEELYFAGIDCMSEALDKKCEKTYFIQDKTIQNLNDAIEYFQNAKQCGNKNCDYYIKNCKNYLNKIIKQENKEFGL